MDTQFKPRVYLKLLKIILRAPRTVVCSSTYKNIRTYSVGTYHVQYIYVCTYIYIYYYICNTRKYIGCLLLLLAAKQHQQASRQINQQRAECEWKFTTVSTHCARETRVTTAPHIITIQYIYIRSTNRRNT